MLLVIIKHINKPFQVPWRKLGYRNTINEVLWRKRRYFYSRTWVSENSKDRDMQHHDYADKIKKKNSWEESFFYLCRELTTGMYLWQITTSLCVLRKRWTICLPIRHKPPHVFFALMVRIDLDIKGYFWIKTAAC